MAHWFHDKLSTPAKRAYLRAHPKSKLHKKIVKIDKYNKSDKQDGHIDMIKRRRRASLLETHPDYHDKLRDHVLNRFKRRTF